MRNKIYVCINIKDNTGYDDITRKCGNINKNKKYDSREDLVVKNGENMLFLK